MKISADPYSDARAHEVFSGLDADDLREAELYLAQPVNRMGLFALWRSGQGSALRIGSYVLSARDRTGVRAVAVLSCSMNGIAGVGEAAFLARDHGRNRRAMVAAARFIRDGIEAFAAENHLNRIEARCWADHPTAGRFLKAIGFKHECDMRGFGPAGGETFCLFAWVAPGVAAKEG